MSFERLNVPVFFTENGERLAFLQKDGRCPEKRLCFPADI
jgi:hypothetical protein